MKTELKELRGKIEEKRKSLQTVFDEAGPDRDMGAVKSLEGDSTAKVESIGKINDEIGELTKQAEPFEKEETTLTKAARAAAELAEVEDHPGHDTKGRQERGRGAEGEEHAHVKSIGEIFIESEAGHSKKGKTVEMDEVGLKTLFQTSAGWEPFNPRTGRLAEMPVRPPQVADAIPNGTTQNAAIVYMQETVFTNNAAPTKEGGAYAESALKVEQKTIPVKKIATFIPVTDEQLEDVPQAQGYVENRLPLMLKQTLDTQILAGAGAEAELLGFLNQAGLLVQAKGEGNAPDALFKAMTKIRVEGQAIASAVMISPLDWQNVRLEKTKDGIYIWGPPSQVGPEQVFGVNVIQAQALTAGTALVGDFVTHSELVIRKGIELKVSDSHEDYFVKGKQAIRADIRVALCVYRVSAFCEVTGL
jgi:hypothetical protein